MMFEIIFCNAELIKSIKKHKIKAADTNCFEFNVKMYGTTIQSV